jgi:hypothetical protein
MFEYLGLSTSNVRGAFLKMLNFCFHPAGQAKAGDFNGFPLKTGFCVFAS